jgi:hypothetical protein
LSVGGTPRAILILAQPVFESSMKPTNLFSALKAIRQSTSIIIEKFRNRFSRCEQNYDMDSILHHSSSLKYKISLRSLLILIDPLGIDQSYSPRRTTACCLTGVTNTPINERALECNTVIFLKSVENGRALTRVKGKWPLCSRVQFCPW